MKYQKPKKDPNNPDSELFCAVAAGKLSLLYTRLEALDAEELSYIIGQEDTEGRTLLHYAGYLDLKNIVVYLMSLGIPFSTDSKGQTVMHAIVYQGNVESLKMLLHMSEYLLLKELTTNLHRLKTQNTSTLETVSNALEHYYSSKVQQIRQFLITQDEFKRNALHFGAMAANTWSCKALDMLLNFEKVPDYGAFLSLFDRLQNFQWNSGKIDDPRRYSRIFLEISSILPESMMRQSFSNYSAQIQTMIREAVNAQDNNGNSPLHTAARSGAYNAVRSLLNNGADKAMVNLDGKTPLGIASTKIVMRYLTSLEELASTQNAEGYQTLLRAGYQQTESRNEFMKSSVHRAVEGKGFLESQIDLKSSINVQDWNMYTPLHSAAMNGNLESAQTLIENGANINALSSYKLTPLHLAASHNQSAVVKYLMFKGANKNPHDHKGRTPLMMAAKAGHIESLTELLQAGANTEEVDHLKATALHYAAMQSKI